ncbi:MAG: bifunctional 4-hydroxy-2-oxoglutarate aldolase/2-dehydro-3-deoxy-phosphogluconate aldolase [Microbacter sp.]
MMRFNKIQVLQAMIETGIVPVFYHPDVNVVKHVMKACYDGGIRAFEFTNRGDFAHEVLAEAVKWGEIHCPELIIGAGTVVDAGTAALYLQLGANFIVSPVTNPDIFKICNRRCVPYVPGCGSASEVGTAHEMGADMVKIFPAGNVGGPSFVKNIKAPMPWTSIMVTGGVEPTEENLSAWFKAGVSCVGMGSNLFPQDVIAKEAWHLISSMCQFSIDIIKKAKQ